MAAGVRREDARGRDGRRVAAGRFVAAGQVQNGGMTGTSSLAIDNANMPAPLNPVIGAGETLYFQNYYRDGIGSNLSNGLAITFVP